MVDDDYYISMGGSLQKYLLASFILLFLGKASEIREVARKSPGSPKEVLSQLLQDL